MSQWSLHQRLALTLSVLIHVLSSANEFYYRWQTGFMLWKYKQRQKESLFPSLNLMFGLVLCHSDQTSFKWTREDSVIYNFMLDLLMWWVIKNCLKVVYIQYGHLNTIICCYWIRSNDCSLYGWCEQNLLFFNPFGKLFLYPNIILIIIFKAKSQNRMLLYSLDIFEHIP